MARQLLIPAHRTILQLSCLLQRLPGLRSLLGPWLRSTVHTSHLLINRPTSLVRRSPLLSKAAIPRARRPPEALHIPPLARRSPTPDLTPEATFTNSRSNFPARAIRLSRPSPTCTTITRNSRKVNGVSRLRCRIDREVSHSRLMGSSRMGAPVSPPRRRRPPRHSGSDWIHWTKSWGAGRESSSRAPLIVSRNRAQNC